MTQFGVKTLLFATVVAACLSAYFAVALNWGTTDEYLDWDQSVFRYNVPIVPHEFDREITFLSTTPGKQYETDDGPTEYLRHHQLGWNDCLYYFYRDLPFHEGMPAWSAVEDEYGQAPWIHGAPPHINDARRDGWIQCANQIQAALQTSNENEFRDKLVKSQMPIILSLVVMGTILLTMGGYVFFLSNSRRTGT